MIESSTQPQERRGKRVILGILLVIGVLIIILAVGATVAAMSHTANVQAQDITVTDSAMLPTYEKNSQIRVQVRPIYRKGDVIAFKDPQTGEKRVRRVIAVAGQTIQIRAGIVQIDGSSLDEPYTSAPAKQDFGPLTVPGGTVFVLGDNRNNSVDSRSFGPVPTTSVLGSNG